MKIATRRRLRRAVVRWLDWISTVMACLAIVVTAVMITLFVWAALVVAEGG